MRQGLQLNKLSIACCLLGVLSLTACGTESQNASQQVENDVVAKEALAVEAHIEHLVPYQMPSVNKDAFSDHVSKTEIEKVADAVIDWQLAQFDIRSNKMRGEFRPSGVPNGWMYATLHVGLWHWAEASDNDTYRQTILNLSQLNDYKLGPRVYHADDHAVGDVYLSLYSKYGDEARIANTKAHLDIVVDKPSEVPLEFNEKRETHQFKLREFVDPYCTSRWCWADAVFMSPPVMAHLSKITGDSKYIDFMDKEFWMMTDYLFDEEYQLYLRDSRYFTRLDDQGRRIFWGRGNGWVLAGLARTIEHMPDSFANKEKYITLFKNMSNALLNYQLEDGSWPSSLLEKNADTHSETSATGLLAFAIAWGINNGHLESATFRPALEKAWQSIVENIHENGKVGYVQQVAYAPGSATFEDTQLYGSGAVLLAASELFKLAE